ncbi:MAG: DUF4928 family protein [Desulfomonilaceae bacterium]
MSIMERVNSQEVLFTQIRLNHISLYRRLHGTKDTVADIDILNGKVAVESIETFVSQNLEEMSLFRTDQLITGFLTLLEKYNDRVNLIETDKSLMIEIPPNLLR